MTLRFLTAGEFARTWPDSNPGWNTSGVAYKGGFD